MTGWQFWHGESISCNNHIWHANFTASWRHFDNKIKL